MKTDKAKPLDHLVMSSEEFDRIMSEALRAKPTDHKKPKKAGKIKATPKAVKKSGP